MYSSVPKPKRKPPKDRSSQICDTITSWDVFDAVDGNGTSLLASWLRKERITKRDIGQLNQKIDLLGSAGPSLPPKLLAGPIKSKKNKKLVSHIYKLIIHGDRMLRPFLCKGPIHMDCEYTMLIGAIEVGNVLDTDAAEGEAVRKKIIADPKLRKTHERHKHQA